MTQESIMRSGDKAPGPDGAPSVVATGLRIIGNVVSGGVVHVEGEVDGDIQCTELTIGAKGRVSGHATAFAVVVFGRMTGTIRAKHVRIASGATVVGEVIHERLTIEAGARLDGFYRPVEKVEMSAAVDVRQQLGRAPQGESVLPRRSLPLSRKRPRGGISLRQPQGLTLKPLH